VPLPPIVVTAPAGGETFSVGQQVHIMWQSTSAQTIMIEVTLDGEETWQQITSTGGISQGSALWGDYIWTVPSIASTSAQALIRVGAYPTGSTPGMSGAFTVLRPDAVGDRAALRNTNGLTIAQQGTAVRFTGPSPSPSAFTVDIHDMAGRHVAHLLAASGSDGVTWTPTGNTPRALVAQVTRLDASGKAVPLPAVLFQLR
jgi:hypothetical protein